MFILTFLYDGYDSQAIGENFRKFLMKHLYKKRKGKGEVVLYLLNRR